MLLLLTQHLYIAWLLRSVGIPTRVVDAPGSPSLSLAQMHFGCFRTQNRCSVSPILLATHLEWGWEQFSILMPYPTALLLLQLCWFSLNFGTAKINFHSVVHISCAVRGKAAAWYVCCEAAHPPRGRSLWAGAELLPLHAWVVLVLLSDRLCNHSHVLCSLAATEAEISSYFRVDQTS